MFKKYQKRLVFPGLLFQVLGQVLFFMERKAKYLLSILIKAVTCNKPQYFWKRHQSFLKYFSSLFILRLFNSSPLFNLLFFFFFWTNIYWWIPMDLLWSRVITYSFRKPQITLNMRGWGKLCIELYRKHIVY